MTEQELERKIRESGVEDTDSVDYFMSLAKAYVAAKDARIEELELVIEYAAACLDLVHPDDYDAWEKINRIYQNLENKTRWEV